MDVITTHFRAQPDVVAGRVQTARSGMLFTQEKAPRRTQHRAQRNHLRRRRNAYAEFSLHYRLHRAIGIVLQMLDGNRTPTCRAFHVADRQCGVMQEQVPVPLELGDTRVDRETVFGRSS